MAGQSQTDLEIQLSMALQGVDRSTADTKRMLQGIRDSANDTFRGVEGSAGRAGGSIGKLSELLREHKSEHVQTARAVKAFTGELEGLLGKHAALAGFMGGVLGGLASGSIFIAAFEAIKGVVEIYNKL